MCKYHFTGKTRKYNYLLDENNKACIVSLETGEVLPPDEALKVWESFSKAFEKALCPEAIKTKKEKSEVVRHKYGEYGWVKLTEQEFQKLQEDLGCERAIQCINFVDELAESNGNKYKWKNFNLVVRKCDREKWIESRQRQQPQPPSETSYDMNLFKERANRLPVYKSNNEQGDS